MVNSRNRDRRGGHKNTPLVGHKELVGFSLSRPNESFYAGDVTRAFIKRESKRAARRHDRITKDAAMALYEDEQEARYLDCWNGPLPDHELYDLVDPYDDYIEELEPEPYDDPRYDESCYPYYDD